MSIGTGIVLFVIGAILTFATDFHIAGLNMDLIGYILMGAGVVVFVLGLIFAFRARSVKNVTNTAVDPATGQRVQETRSSTTGV